MRRQAPEDRSARDEDHLTETTERGAFILARCSCGWAGPARRARAKARADAASHPGNTAARDVSGPAA
ncbi:hypothetical protein ACH437_29555 [Streptomyces xinghaiensis]|uniref:hypothetical protein n=1 Tax=Streptomyces xinghaiensis TaxID=1038928 RepID=UPI0037AF1014